MDNINRISPSLQKKQIEKDNWTFERLPFSTRQKIEFFKYMKEKGNRTLKKNWINKLDEQLEDEKYVKPLVEEVKELYKLKKLTQQQEKDNKESQD